MADIGAVKRALALHRPTAKFVDVVHWEDFDSLAAPDMFYLANIYDERIHSNLLHLRKIDARVLINNDYTSSFAHGMAVSWAWGMSDGPEVLDALMGYTIKKFLAEQLYIDFDCIQSRTLLLETLLYEQDAKYRKFQKIEGTAAYSTLRASTTVVAADIFAYHEFGHYLLARYPEYFSFMVDNGYDCLLPLIGKIRAAETRPFVEEFSCDIIAVIACLAHAPGDFLLVLRLLAFSFSAYAAMYCAEKTASGTAALWKGLLPDSVDFFDITPMGHRDHDVLLAGDMAMIRRAQLVLSACEVIAEARGVELFGMDEPFPLTRDILHTLLVYVRDSFECRDENARRSSNLVARALHGHKEGMDYLYRHARTLTARNHVVPSRWK